MLKDGVGTSKGGVGMLREQVGLLKNWGGMLKDRVGWLSLGAGMLYPQRWRLKRDWSSAISADAPPTGTESSR